MVRSGLRYLRSNPFSVSVAVTVLITGFIFSLPRTHATRWVAAGPVTTGEEHLWWTSVTALLVPGSLLDALLSAAVALTVMAYIERLIGTARTVLAYFGVGAMAILSGIALHLLTIWLGTPLLLLARPELSLDPAIGVFGVLMTGSAFAPVLFRRRIRVIGFAVVLTFALYGGDQDSFYRVIAALLGLALGAALGRGMPVARTRPRARGWRRASYGEVRTLVAAVVAVTGVGPVIVLLDRTLVGPLALVVSGIAQVNGGEAFEACATYFRSACDAPGDIHMIAHGVGRVLLSLVPVALSLVAAWGLRAGRRAAWAMALAVNAVTLVATAAAVGVLSLSSLQGIERVGERFALSAVLAVGVPLAVIILLALTRRRFEVTAARDAVRRFWLTVGIAFVAVIALWVVAFITIGGSAVPVGPVPLAVRDIFLGLIVVLLPAGYTRGIAHGRVPGHGVVVLADQWAGVAFWLAVIVAAIVLLRSIGHSDVSQARFRELLRTIGGGTMSFMGTWEGARHWIGESGAVAYRLVRGVALVISDPVAPPGAMAGVLDGFLAFCDRQGWTPVFYGIHTATRDALRARGWRDVSVGEETVIHPAALELAGGRGKRVRQALAKADRLGVQMIWTTWKDLPTSRATQIEVLSEHWVSEKALPELGFTLGGIAELRDPDVALLLAVGADGELQAVTSWLPSWRDGTVTGWTLDFMRRADDAMPEIMVAVIATAALRMREAGVGVMSLSGAPLVTPPVAEGQLPSRSSLLSRILGWLADVLEPVYGFRSLFEFKQKFHPELETVYMSYQDAASLPAAASAILRAYLPTASPRQALAIVRGLSARRS